MILTVLFYSIVSVLFNNQVILSKLNFFFFVILINHNEFWRGSSSKIFLAMNHPHTSKRYNLQYLPKLILKVIITFKILCNYFFHLFIHLNKFDSSFYAFPRHWRSLILTIMFRLCLKTRVSVLIIRTRHLIFYICFFIFLLRETGIGNCLQQWVQYVLSRPFISFRRDNFVT